MAADIRVGSPSFEQHLCCELSARDRNRVYSAEDLAWGCSALGLDTEAAHNEPDD